MANQITTWYLVKKAGRQICIELIHCSNNKGAAQRDMMALFGLSSADIVTFSASVRNPWPSLPCNCFDGTRSH